jgi:hypothetical protein
MAAEVRNLTIDAVKEGDQLPRLDVDVSATTIILGALAARDWRPMHHDKDFAINRNGTKDIFMNTPAQAHWFERYLTDWTGPKGRMGRMKFRMRASVFPEDTMTFNATVENVETDDVGCGWANLAVNLTVGEKTVTSCTARIAIPTDPDDNPWKRKGDDWKP